MINTINNNTPLTTPNTATSNSSTVDPGTGSGNRWDPVLNMMTNRQNTLDKFADLMSTFTALVGEIAKARTEFSNGIKAGQDNKIDFLENKIRAVLDQITGNPDYYQALYTSTTADNAGNEAAVKWAQEMGLDPNKCVSQAADGTWVVRFDMAPVDTMKHALDPYAYLLYGKTTLTTQQYDALVTALEAQISQVNNTAQLMAQKYGETNTNTANSMKIMSSAIENALEQLKAILAGSAV